MEAAIKIAVRRLLLFTRSRRSGVLPSINRLSGDGPEYEINPYPERILRTPLSYQAYQARTCWTSSITSSELHKCSEKSSDGASHSGATQIISQKIGRRNLDDLPRPNRNYFCSQMGVGRPTPCPSREQLVHDEQGDRTRFFVLGWGDLFLLSKLQIEHNRVWRHDATLMVPLFQRHGESEKSSRSPMSDLPIINSNLS